MMDAAHHGGKRRRHVLPAITPEQLQVLRELRAQGFQYKVLERLYDLSRYTLSRAINKTRTYKS